MTYNKPINMRIAQQVEACMTTAKTEYFIRHMRAMSIVEEEKLRDNYYEIFNKDYKNSRIMDRLLHMSTVLIVTAVLLSTYITNIL